MKSKIFLSLFVFILAFSFTTVAQPKDVDPEFGDGTRKVDDIDYPQINFGTITDEVVSKEITIKNTKSKPLTIEAFSIPGGIGVVIIDKIIKPGQEGKYIISVHPKYIEQGDFYRYIVVETTYQSPMGASTIKEEAVYEIVGIKE